MQTLRTIRRARELTFLDLALLTGIPARVLAEAEYGLRHLNPREAEVIALVLGIQPTVIRSLPPQIQARFSLAPPAMAAGLATMLALSPLLSERGQHFQHYVTTVALQQVSMLLQSQADPIAETIRHESHTATPAIPPSQPIQRQEGTSLRPYTTSSIRSPLPTLPPPEVLAPLVAPLPSSARTPAAPQFYLDETGPHGCPVQPTTGQVVITQGYGVGSHTPTAIWGAIDLAVDGNGDGIAEPEASWYAPVVATHDGKVRVTLDSYPAGHHVWVLAADGIWRTGYSHLAIVTVIDGQQVRAGDVIGLMGSTGFASGPHLDYQVWRGEVNIDPTTLVGCDR
ncbi:peptidoglycan DD-metalloendopeptidase family protein [Chloroflexus sp. Y-396-1]|uniref:peptidoglycan DD-metalloendopeptidase family protein n=1 Tax=Chloroflexus sp. Y-396-1 TaxID=867845 RepID=UPI00048ECA68|nr:peptidoglycan DD-metalloendopeptidase family protein [Chloroflexus sp. Y-396-1]